MISKIRMKESLVKRKISIQQTDNTKVEVPNSPAFIIGDSPLSTPNKDKSSTGSKKTPKDKIGKQRVFFSSSINIETANPLELTPSGSLNTIESGEGDEDDEEDVDVEDENMDEYLKSLEKQVNNSDN